MSGLLFLPLPPAGAQSARPPAPATRAAAARPASPAAVQRRAQPAFEPTVISREDAAAGAERVYREYIRGRLAAGARLTTFSLRTHSQGEPYHGSFVGSVTRIKEDQRYWPPHLFLEYKLAPTHGVGLAGDAFRVKAGDAEGDDGAVAASGTLLYGFGRLPNATPCVPFGELGLGFYSARFEEAGHWDRANIKEFVLDDSIGYYLALGCDVGLDPNWSVNLYGRRTALDIDGTFYVLRAGEREREDGIHFPMAQWTFGLGVKYSF